MLRSTPSSHLPVGEPVSRACERQHEQRESASSRLFVSERRRVRSPHLGTDPAICYQLHFIPSGQTPAGINSAAAAASPGRGSPACPRSPSGYMGHEGGPSRVSGRETPRVPPLRARRDHTASPRPVRRRLPLRVSRATLLVAHHVPRRTPAELGQRLLLPRMLPPRERLPQQVEVRQAARTNSSYQSSHCRFRVSRATATSPLIITGARSGSPPPRRRRPPTGSPHARPPPAG